MSKKLNKTAYWRMTTLQEALASKVITRVVSDGISLRNAVREAIKVAELNKQEIFLLLSTLQDYGIVHNGDFKNYWSNGWGEGVGEEGINAHKGTNYYASNNNKIITANENGMFSLFNQIDTLRSFASDEEIIEINPELEEVIAVMNKTKKIINALNIEDAAEQVEKVKNKVNSTPQEIPESFFQKAFNKAISIYKQKESAGQNEPFEEIFYNLTGNHFPNINWKKMEPIIKKFIPNYSPLAHVEPKVSSNNKKIKTATQGGHFWTHDPGDEFEESDNYNEDLEELEKAFNLTDEDEDIEKENLGVSESVIKPRKSFILAKRGKWVVNVGNIGNIPQKSKAEARETFKDYVEQSMFGKGRCAGEPVALLDPNGDIVDLYDPNTEDEDIEKKSSLRLRRNLLAQAQEELLVEEPETPAESSEGLDSIPIEEDEEITVEETETPTGDMNIEITPTPEELIAMAKEGPTWEIKNMLSINKAEEYYNQLKKQLEDVVFNPNIKIDLNGISEYDKVRNMIDSELNKINDAIKGKEKIEKKEEKLEKEIKEPSREEITVEETGTSQQKTVAPEGLEGLEEAEPSIVK